MHASTVVTRTPAGNAELANPAHGLSLVQRRFLTLLDTARSIEELAARQRGDPAKVGRDLARLASLGLVACQTPAANEAEALSAANDAAIGVDNDAPGADDQALGKVRLGPRPASSRRPYVLASLGAVVAGLVVWRLLSSPAPLIARDSIAPPVAHPPAPVTPATPDAIATKVLLDDTAPSARTRELAREAPKAKSASEAAKLATPDARPPTAPPPRPVPLQPLAPIQSRLTAPEPFVAVPLALPIERRSPPPLAAPVASAPLTAETREAKAALHVASVAPSAAANAPSRPLVAIAQEAPAFPREAIAAGLSNGNVKARLVIDAKGGVTNVEIVDTSHRAFDRAVRDALFRWRFEAGAPERSTTVDVAFKRD